MRCNRILYPVYIGFYGISMSHVFSHMFSFPLSGIFEAVTQYCNERSSLVVFVSFLKTLNIFEIGFLFLLLLLRLARAL